MEGEIILIVFFTTSYMNSLYANFNDTIGKFIVAIT